MTFKDYIGDDKVDMKFRSKKGVSTGLAQQAGLAVSKLIDKAISNCKYVEKADVYVQGLGIKGNLNYDEVVIDLYTKDCDIRITPMTTDKDQENSAYFQALYDLKTKIEIELHKSKIFDFEHQPKDFIDESSARFSFEINLKRQFWRF